MYTIYKRVCTLGLKHTQGETFLQNYTASTGKAIFNKQLTLSLKIESRSYTNGGKTHTSTHEHTGYKQIVKLDLKVAQGQILVGLQKKKISN